MTDTPDDRPPLFRTWTQAYAVVVMWLVVCILLLVWLTVAF